MAGGFSASELQNVKSTLSADNYGNDSTMEMSWAIKAFEHAEVYFKLITAIDPLHLKLTNADDAIYEKFCKDFPNLDVEVISEDEIKSPSSKAEWRKYCNSFEGAVEDWNFATLLRLDCKNGVDEKNTTVVPRIQFLAIEIARNRRGLNSSLREKFKAKKEETT